MAQFCNYHETIMTITRERYYWFTVIIIIAIRVRADHVRLTQWPDQGWDCALFR